jgi:arylsulfatase A-like enzyme
VLVPKLRIRNPEIAIEPVGTWRLTERADGLTAYGVRLPATLEIDNPTGETVDTDLKLFARLLLGNPGVRSLYADEVSYVDREIGRLLDGLSARGLLDNTLLVFTSDHGEGLGDHGLVGHISQLYDTLLDVPLMLTWPGRLPAGRVVDEPVALVDVFPTIAELVGAPGPADPSGRSLAAVMRGAALPPTPMLAETHRPQAPRNLRAIALGGFKYIRTATDKGGVEELYDLSRDPDELTDLAASWPGKLRELGTALDRAVAEMVAVDAIEAELNDDEEAQLRALGYVR